MATNESGGSAPFPLTSWTFVKLAARDREALDEFVRAYRRPMRRFLIRIGVPSAQAEDALQDFVAQKLLTGKLLSRADPKVGGFRQLLKQALRNSAVDFHRREGRWHRLGPLADPQVLRRGDEQEAFDVFDWDWARRIVEQTIQRMRSGYSVDQWRVFEGRLWAPLVLGTPVVPYEDLCQQLQLKDSKEVANLLVSAKRRFAAVLRVVVGESTTTETETQDELQELRRVLLSRPAADWRRLLGTDSDAVSGNTWAPCKTAHGPRDESATSRLSISSNELAGTGSAASDALLDIMDSSSLAVALQIDVDTEWTAEDLRQILGFYLSRPASELPGLARTRRRNPRTEQAVGEKPTTLGELLQQPHPELKLLEEVKRGARKELRAKDASMPRQPAEAIYFTSIAAALVRCRARISSSPANMLRAGFDLHLSCEWLPSWQRELLLAARQTLEANS